MSNFPISTSPVSGEPELTDLWVRKCVCGCPTSPVDCLPCLKALKLYSSDHVRRRARDLAWNGQDGQMSARYNRFERMRRRTQRSDGPYQLEVPIEIVNRIYEPPARTDETQSAQPSGSAPQSIVDESEIAHRASQDSGETISEHTSCPARPNLRSDSPDLQLDQGIQSARYSRRRPNILRALRFWLPNLTSRFRLVRLIIFPGSGRC